MKKSAVLLLGLLAFAIFLGGATWLYQKAAAEADLLPVPPPVTPNDGSDSIDEPERVQAVDFTVKDQDGNDVSLSEFYGKPIVVNFWASWCPPCKGEMPDFQEMYEEYGDEVAFLMVDMVDGNRETLETGKSYIAEQGFTFPVFYDVDQMAAYTYGVYSLPSTLFIGRDGYITGAQVGMISKSKLETQIGIVLSTEEGLEEVSTEKNNPAQCDVEPEYRKLTPENAKQLMGELENYRFIDVRTEQEYREGYIEGAEWIEDRHLLEEADSLLPNKDEFVLIYCRSGRRSEVVARELLAMGYTNVFDLGGIIDWSFKDEIINP